MQAGEGKLGRIFLIRLERGDAIRQVLEKFAIDNEIPLAQVLLTSETGAASGAIIPDAGGTPRLRLPGEIADKAPTEAEVMLQEVLGIVFQRRRDPVAKRDTLAPVPAPALPRVADAPAPVPVITSPGTVPVYLFNVEIN